MAKRTLGLGKAAKAKKQKTDEPVEKAASNEITVELTEEADANDELAQLTALWNTYNKSEKENELVVNGIIHECDRLLRNSADSQESSLPDTFHSIYALALAELANFEVEDKNKVEEYFNAALERVDLGLGHFGLSIDLLFTKSKILIHRIPLQYIAQTAVDTTIGTVPKLSTLLDEALAVYETAEAKADELNDYSLFNEDNLEILEAVDDLLDIVDNFGKDIAEGQDDDDEDEQDEVVELDETHPLYEIRDDDKYNQWWRDHILVFLRQVDNEMKKLDVDFTKETKQDEDEHALLPLRREICKRIGQSYLQESEVPSLVFTTLTYDDGYEGVDELHGLSLAEAQKIAQELNSTALKYLEWAQDRDEPETWVHVAEAMISLGNLYEVDSTQQEEYYQRAEKILDKANNVTNGKYDDVLENLLKN